MANKKQKLSGFTLTPITKTSEVELKNPLDIDKAADAIHRNETIKVEQSINSEIKQSSGPNFRRPKGNRNKRQSVVNVQVPTPKDLYMKLKGLIIDREDIKGMKYLYLDAVEYYLQNKIYDEQKNTTSEL